MSSLRRIQSSRANGAKSRGPITPAGRHKSAYNNLRHGILAETVVLEDENADTFNEILAALKREFDPQTEAQLGLVETMAAARWRLMRIWSIERQTLESEIGKHDPAAHEPAARAARAFHDLANNSRTLDILNRYETRYDRQYVRSLNLLLKLSGENNPPAAPSEPLTPDEAPSWTDASQFCQTNLSGVGLPAYGTPAPHPGPAAESASLAPEPSPTELPAHADAPPFCQTNPVPLLDSPALESSSCPAPPSEPSAAPAHELSATSVSLRLCGELSPDPRSQDFEIISDQPLTPVPRAA